MVASLSDAVADALPKPFLVVLMLVSTACSIERTRQLGDRCLADRECAAGLACVLDPAGGSRCAAPVNAAVDAAPADLAGDVAAELSRPVDASGGDVSGTELSVGPADLVEVAPSPVDATVADGEPSG